MRSWRRANAKLNYTGEPGEDEGRCTSASTYTEQLPSFVSVENGKLSGYELCEKSLFVSVTFVFLLQFKIENVNNISKHKVTSVYYGIYGI